MELNSSVAAVVTGGASGLGEATARALAARGVRVAIFDMNEQKGEAVAADIGGVFCKVNVTSDDDVDAGFAKARAAHGQERILINCAGTGNAAKTASQNAAMSILVPIVLGNGVPVTPITTTAGYLTDVSTGQVSPTGPVDAVRGTVTGKASPESRNR